MASEAVIPIRMEWKRENKGVEATGDPQRAPVAAAGMQSIRPSCGRRTTKRLAKRQRELIVSVIARE